MISLLSRVYSDIINALFVGRWRGDQRFSTPLNGGDHPLCTTFIGGINEKTQENLPNFSRPPAPVVNDISLVCPYFCPSLYSFLVYPIFKFRNAIQCITTCPVDNFGTVVGENPTPYGNLALWAVNGLSIVYWVVQIYPSFRVWYAISHIQFSGIQHPTRGVEFFEGGGVFIYRLKILLGGGIKFETQI